MTSETVPSGNPNPGTTTVTDPAAIRALGTRRSRVNSPLAAKNSATAYNTRRAGDSFIVNVMKSSRTCANAREYQGRCLNASASVPRVKNL